MIFSKHRGFFVAFFLLITGYLLLAHSASAQMTDAQKTAQEAQWQAELTATEAEIAQWQGILDTTKKGTASLQNDAAILQAKINEAKAFIKQRQIQIQKLTSQIDLKTQTINQLQDQIDAGKESLAGILRSTNELDSYSLAEAMLSNTNLSQFFEDFDSYNSICQNFKKKAKQKKRPVSQKQNQSQNQDQKSVMH